MLWSACARAYGQLGRSSQLKTVARAMELRFRECAVADIARFVSSYVEGFFELYSDTGVWSEDVILQGVHSNGKKLFRDVYDAVDLQLSRRRVCSRSAELPLIQRASTGMLT